jgi:hypothetical protein
MPYYRLQRRGDAGGDAYWVAAVSEVYARRLVALFLPDAADVTKVDCRLTPIQRRAAPLFIVRRSNELFSLAMAIVTSAGTIMTSLRWRRSTALQILADLCDRVAESLDARG